MNIEKLIPKQKELDELLKITHNFQPKDVIYKGLLALYVEIAELANEVQSFKYWKKNKKIDRNLIIEEFSDGIHFLLSFLLTFKIDSFIIDEIVATNDINKQFLLCFGAINDFIRDQNKEKLLQAFSLYLGIIKLLNFSDEEIISAYFSKNKKNFDRIKNNY